LQLQFIGIWSQSSDSLLRHNLDCGDQLVLNLPRASQLAQRAYLVSHQSTWYTVN